MREVIQFARSQEDQSPLMSRHNSHSHSHARPHSVHIDLSDRDERLESGESPNLTVPSAELLMRSHLGNSTANNNNLNTKSSSSSSRQANGKEVLNHKSSSQETENSNVADTGT